MNANGPNTLPCPDCGQTVSRLAASCPHCGGPMPPKTSIPEGDASTGLPRGLDGGALPSGLPGDEHRGLPSDGQTSTPSQQPSAIVKIVAGVLVGVPALLCFGICSGVLGPGGDGPKEPVFQGDASPAAQQERRDLMKKLCDDGIFLKVEWLGLGPKIWVTPSFMMLDVDAKNKCCGVVYAYYAVDRPEFGDSEIDCVRLKSSLTGEFVGAYNPCVGGVDIH